MLIYREYEQKENCKRLVLEIIFRECDGKLQSASGLIKANTTPKGGFRLWCKNYAWFYRYYNKLFNLSNSLEFSYCWFGWNLATLTKVNQICEFSRKHPNGTIGIIQLKKEN